MPSTVGMVRTPGRGLVRRRRRSCPEASATRPSADRTPEAALVGPAAMKRRSRWRTGAAAMQRHRGDDGRAVRRPATMPRTGAVCSRQFSLGDHQNGPARIQAERSSRRCPPRPAATREGTPLWPDTMSARGRSSANSVTTTAPALPTPPERAGRRAGTGTGQFRRSRRNDSVRPERQQRRSTTREAEGLAIRELAVLLRPSSIPIAHLRPVAATPASWEPGGRAAALTSLALRR